jgi:DNA (cytosine-5)-methyltransferase 1
LNAKKHGVPQNRERVFIVGIRDDNDLTFRWPKEEQLTKKLKDVLESDIDEKYFLSEKMIEYISSTGTKNFYYKPELLGNESKYSKPITTAQDKRAGTTNYLKIKSATSKGYETATENDSINFSVPNSGTRRGRVGKGVAQTLDTQCNQGVFNDYKIRRLTPRECFRLMDFPDSFTWPVSDSQAYKQAGNSIVVGVLEKIIERLNLE